MWNLKDSNKVVGIQNKVNSFKKHINAVYSIKPHIKLDEPWKPSFSLSKFKNKYHRLHTMQLTRQNQTLVTHLNNISNDDKFNTFLEIPKTVPSNKETFKHFRKRQRKREQHTVQKQNQVMTLFDQFQKILSKIKSINSTYAKQNYNKEWKQIVKYKMNITKKQLNPDFYELAKRSYLGESHAPRMSWSNHSQSETKLRPKTALPR